MRDRYTDQASAPREGTFPNAGDAITNRDARQAGAFLEGLFPDACDRLAINGSWYD